MRTSFYLLLSTICLCCALPALPTPPTDLLPSSTTEVTEGRKFEVAEPEKRQGAILAALGAGLAPILVSFFRPLLSQLASTVTSAVMGKLQEMQPVSDSEPINYDAYMINSPNSPGPYLFLTNPKIDNSENNRNTKRPLDVQIPSSSLITGALSSSHPNLSIGKPASIKKHIGRISIKSPQPENDESKENEGLTELRVINSPTYDMYSDDVVVRRRSNGNY